MKRIAPSLFPVLIAAATVRGLAEPSPPLGTLRDVTVKTVDAGVTYGQVLSLSLRRGLLLRTAEGLERAIPTDDIVRINAGPDGDLPERWQARVSLVGGDLLFGRIISGGGDALVLQTNDLGEHKLPLDSIAAVDTSQSQTPAYRGFLDRLSGAGTPEEDCVVLTNGDVARGFVTAVDADELAIETRLGETRIPFRLVLSVRLATPQPGPLSSAAFIVTFIGGERLTARDFAWTADEAKATFRHGQSSRFDARRIARIDVIGGRWEWLARHQPISFEHTPALSLDWPFVADRNVLGGPISVEGSTFEHGIGVHSRSSLTFDLRGEYREFATYFGMDDDSGPFADVTVMVLVDGKRRFQQEHVRRGRLHGPIRLDVAKANRIELLVDFGDNGDIQDRFNWVETALVR